MVAFYVNTVWDKHLVDVFHRGDRNQGKFDMFTLGRFRHQFNKTRMYQHTRDGNRPSR